MIPLSIRVNLYRKGGFFCNRNSINLIFYPRDSTKIWRCERDELLYIDWFLNIHTICSGFICIYIFNTPLSIIGPRPALWNQYDLIEERDKYGANDIKPGLTGWAQINGRDAISIQDKAQYDGIYAKNLSFVFDIKCFFLSIIFVLRRDGVLEGGAAKVNAHSYSNEVYEKETV
jgi:hypothetical protein